MELWENGLNKRSTNEAAKSPGSRDLFNFINLRVDAISLAVIGCVCLMHLKHSSLVHPENVTAQ